MTASDERMTILRMIESGKISADEGARLLAALSNATAQEETTKESSSPIAGDMSGRYLRVRITDTVTEHQKVGVNVPLGLIDIALRFVPPHSAPPIQEIKEAIHNRQLGRIVDVLDEDDGQRIEVFIE